MPMPGAYDDLQVALSVLIAISASYAALDLAGRVTATRGWTCAAWLTGGAIALGLGIWSMHYVGMLAFRLPVPVGYDWPTVLGSFMAGIVSSAFALILVSRDRMGLVHLTMGSLTLGSGIVALHYIAMAAMRLPADIRFDALLVTLSVGLAIAFSLAALWLAFAFRGETTGAVWRKMGSALLMGGAISAMHYTSMAAASFIPSDEPLDLSRAVSITSLGTTGIAAVTLLVLGLAVVSSTVARRFSGQAVELQASEARYRQLFEGSLAGIYRITPGGRILDCNDACVRILGYASQDELLSRRWHDLFQRPDDWNTFLTLIRERTTLTNFERCLRRKDQSPVWVLENTTLISNQDLAAPVIEGTLVDITERKQAEEKLRRSEAYLAGAEQLSHMGSWAITVATGELFWSHEHFRILGLDPHGPKPPYPTAFEVIHPDDRARVQAALERAIHERSEFEAECRIVRPDGTVRDIKSLAHPVTNESGALTEYVGTIIDITERKQSQEHLRALTIKLSRTEVRERKRLATDLHDHLAQALAVAKMKGEALQRGHDPAKAWAELKGLLDEALTYTRSLMADLRPPLLGDEQDLRRAIVWVTERLQRRGLRVSVRDDGSPKILDEDVLTVTYQALQELLNNVVKHAQTSTATISLATIGDNDLEAAVSDEGVGFEVSDLHARATDSFGLLNIRERVESLGGRLEIASTLNEGTCARIVVPLRTRPEVSRSTDERRTTATLTSKERIARAGEMLGHKIRVLLVDDHRVMREGLRHILEGEADLEVVGEAADGQMAIELTHTLHPDVEVMDVNMPRMNGMEATRQITAEFPDVRVIGLSMHEDERIIDEMRQAGAVAYLSKTDASEALCKTIRDSLKD